MEVVGAPEGARATGVEGRFFTHILIVPPYFATSSLLSLHEKFAANPRTGSVFPAHNFGQQIPAQLDQFFKLSCFCIVG